MMTADINFTFFPDLETASDKAAHLILQQCHNCLQRKNFFSLVLTGGSTPRRLYEILATSFFADKIPWPQIHLFWGDERHVPSDHKHSNFHLAHEALLKHVNIPEHNIHNIQTEGLSSSDGAIQYQNEILNFFHIAPHLSQNKIPQFDLILLGLGTDGHTASLFPSSPLLTEKNELVAAVSKPSGKPAVERITFTFPLLNRAKCILFLAGGHEKINIIREIQESYHNKKNTYPAGMVSPVNKLDWFVFLD